MRRLRSSLVLSATLCSLLLLAGCKQDLYSNLSEVEANQMMAVLMSSGIAADKTNIGEAFTLRVENDDMVRAISVLNSKGYPKRTRESIGSVFQKSGIISSPFEERVRYIYALGEDVAQTLSQIDGVVTARVHVVLPDQPQLGQPVKPSSAAVFIKHEPGVDLEYYVPQIRRLVSSSIEGLPYDAVTVVMTEAMPAEVAQTDPNVVRTVDVLPGLAIRDTDVDYFWRLVIGVGLGLVLLIAAGVGGTIFMLRRRRKSGARNNALVETGGNPALEPS